MSNHTEISDLNVLYLLLDPLFIKMLRNVSHTYVALVRMCFMFV